MIIDYLVKNSNLLERRANIELANAFAEISQDFDKKISQKLWELSLFLISFTSDIAPTNDPKEFLAGDLSLSVGIFIKDLHSTLPKQ